jgi:hypothetical protein
MCCVALNIYPRFEQAGAERQNNAYCVSTQRLTEIVIAAAATITIRACQTACSIRLGFLRR